MRTDNIKKVLLIVLIIGLIVFQAYRTLAVSPSEIFGENNETSSLNTGNNSVTNLFTNTGNTNTNTVNTTNTTNTNLTMGTSNTNTSLPKTGANENAVIALMVVCAIAGIYTFKKVKEYNNI